MHTPGWSQPGRGELQEGVASAAVTPVVSSTKAVVTAPTIRRIAVNLLHHLGV